MTSIYIKALTPNSSGVNNQNVRIRKAVSIAAEIQPHTFESYSDF